MKSPNADPWLYNNELPQSTGHRYFDAGALARRDPAYRAWRAAERAEREAQQARAEAERKAWEERRAAWEADTERVMAETGDPTKWR